MEVHHVISVFPDIVEMRLHGGKVVIKEAIPYGFFFRTGDATEECVLSDVAGVNGFLRLLHERVVGEESLTELFEREGFEGAETSLSKLSLSAQRAMTTTVRRLVSNSEKRG